MRAMQVENSFPVAAPPDSVYEYLIDVNRVVACVPGAQLSEVVDPDTFKGRVRIKVGPVTVSYNGSARITGRDARARSATIEAEGRETTGSGSARATATMTVSEDGAGSTVRIATDFTVVGRVAQFGRGIMEEVSKRLVGQMGDCIRSRLEAGAAEAATAGTTEAAAPRSPAPSAESSGAATSADRSEPAGPDDAAPGSPAGTTTRPPLSVPTAAGPEPEPAPVDALSLAGSIARDRLRPLAGPRGAGLGAIILGLIFLLRRRARRRRRRRTG